MTVLVTDAHEHVQRLVLVVKMATVLQHITEHLLWAKELNTKDIHKEVFPVYVEKNLSRKAVPSSWQICWRRRC
jgi:hypothetical protein